MGEDHDAGMDLGWDPLEGVVCEVCLICANVYNCAGGIKSAREGNDPPKD